MGLADLHMHTTYSLDGTATVAQVLERAADLAGLQVVAITDHDCILGALEAEQLAPRYGLEVVPGVEISSRQGHILGLFIRELVPAGLSAFETIARIKALGGLAIIPHPIARGSLSLGETTLRELVSVADFQKCLVGIEVFNGGPLSEASNRAAGPLAGKLNLAEIASSDSHVLTTVGTGVTAFFGRSASALRRALVLKQTKAIPRPTLSPRMIMLHWLAARLKRIVSRTDSVVRKPSYQESGRLATHQPET